jgi:hypothetical protein
MFMHEFLYRSCSLYLSEMFDLYIQKKLYVYTCWICEINSWPAALGETSINLDKKIKILILCSMFDELGFYASSSCA